VPSLAALAHFAFIESFMLCLSLLKSFFFGVVDFFTLATSSSASF